MSNHLSTGLRDVSLSHLSQLSLHRKMVDPPNKKTLTRGRLPGHINCGETTHSIKHCNALGYQRVNGICSFTLLDCQGGLTLKQAIDFSVFCQAAEKRTTNQTLPPALKSLLLCPDRLAAALTGAVREPSFLLDALVD